MYTWYIHIYYNMNSYQWAIYCINSGKIQVMWMIWQNHMEIGEVLLYQSWVNIAHDALHKISGEVIPWFPSIDTFTIHLNMILSTSLNLHAYTFIMYLNMILSTSVNFFYTFTMYMYLNMILSTVSWLIILNKNVVKTVREPSPIWELYQSNSMEKSPVYPYLSNCRHRNLPCKASPEWQMCILKGTSGPSLKGLSLEGTPL